MTQSKWKSGIGQLAYTRSQISDGFGEAHGWEWDRKEFQELWTYSA